MQTQLIFKLLLLLWLTSVATTAWSQQDEMLIENDAVTEPEAPIESPISVENPVQIPNFSGIYMKTDDTDLPWLLSVHTQNDEIIIIDINQHLNFLKKIDYISPEEAEQGIAVFAYDRALHGKIVNYQTAQRNYQSYLAPILPITQRASSYSEKYAVPTHYLQKAFLINATFYQTVDTVSGEISYNMQVSRDTGLFFFDFGSYYKVF